MEREADCKSEILRGPEKTTGVDRGGCRIGIWTIRWISVSLGKRWIIQQMMLVQLSNQLAKNTIGSHTHIKINSR